MRWTLNWVFSVEQVYNDDDSWNINPMASGSLSLSCSTAKAFPRSTKRLTAQGQVTHETSHQMKDVRTTTNRDLFPFGKKRKGTLFPEKKLPSSHTQLPKVKWVLMNIGLNCATNKKNKGKTTFSICWRASLCRPGKHFTEETHQKPCTNLAASGFGYYFQSFYGGLAI